MRVTRRRFVSRMGMGTAALLSQGARTGLAESMAFGLTVTGRSEVPPGRADVTLRIGQVTVDVAKNRTYKTTAYNGSVPGPVIQLREGVPITVEIFNDTDAPEYVHWHGLTIPAELDGTEEEKGLV